MRTTIGVDDPVPEAEPRPRPVARVAHALAAAGAMLGGAVLLALVAMTVASVAGRALTAFGLGPVRGDFEYTEAGIAFAVFAFLPWTQWRRAHASVDLFARGFGARANRVIDVIVDGSLAAVAIVVAWRLALGMLDKRSYAETTFILQLPLWWAYAACLAAAVLWCVVALLAVVDGLAGGSPSRTAPDAVSEPV